MTTAVDPSVRFHDLGLSDPVLDALDAVGYEAPSPIQAATIPPLLEGRDLLGQAQTGTGKTAAFALPILARLDLGSRTPQALVLAPTRELAIQVAEAFQKYASRLPGFHVLPVYGGQSYGPQLQALRRGVHVVVGTPGRVLDHMKRGTLDFSDLKTLVLDEADEMLRMGFIEDVEYVLQETPPQRQVALFSATMPPPIRRIATTYLRTPVEITIKAKTTTATNIRQRYWAVGGGMAKLDALTRILEAEPFEAMIVFARTKAATQELADRLEARGYSAAALNGDMEQRARELTVQRLKDGRLDIVVATDVAARGLDVERISHVLNYDIPTDTESYVHRIGRTGRAGRSGEAILFVAPRERHLLKLIEKATRQPLTPMALPSVADVNARRIERFGERIDAALASEGLEAFRAIVEDYATARSLAPLEVAAALARLVQGDRPLLMDEREEAPAPAAAPRLPYAPVPDPRAGRKPHDEGRKPAAREDRRATAAPQPAEPASHRSAFADRRPKAPAQRRDEHAISDEEAFERRPPAAKPPGERPRRERPRDDEVTRETYRVEVGETHGVKPGNLVGAIANETGLDAGYIGRIRIESEHSLIDLPAGMPRQVFRDLQKVWVSGRQLRISRVEPQPASQAAPRPGRPPSRRDR